MYVLRKIPFYGYLKMELNCLEYEFECIELLSMYKNIFVIVVQSHVQSKDM